MTPPRVTEEVVREREELGMNRVWMQPRSEEAVAFCRGRDIEVVHGTCLRVPRRKLDL